MALNTNIIVSKLDFDGIRQSLVQFLQGQSTFKDYNFEGSALSTLINLLSYNTAQNAYIANMVASEMFLDSAQLRSSVVSRAKELGYIPNSYRASTAVLNINFGSTKPNQDYVEYGDVFIGNKGTDSFNYTALGNYRIQYNTSTQEWFASKVIVKQGDLRSYSYIVSSNNSKAKYIIPTQFVDTSTIIVKVQASKEDTTGFEDSWTQVSSINNLDGNSKVYFLEETENGYFQVFFGDGILGKKLENNNVVILQYLQTSGDEANDTGDDDSTTNPSFTYNRVNTSKVSVESQSLGGAAAESIDSIKYFAPLAYQAQERAVTKTDYEVLLKRDYPNLESVVVWGGEESDPPQYGKVFIAIKPNQGTTLTQSEKLAIQKNLVQKRNVVTIMPEIVDTDPTYIRPSVTVYYNIGQTTKTPSQIEQIVLNAILDYSSNNLEKFERNFRYSKFSTAIDNSEISITHNISLFTLQKLFEPALQKTVTYVVQFNSPIYHPQNGYGTSVLSSSAFGYYDRSTDSNVDCYLDDNGSGVVRIYKIVDEQKIYINNNIGTIEYSAGTITLKNFTPQYNVPPLATSIALTIKPANNDFISVRNQFFEIRNNSELDTTSIQIEVFPESTESAIFDNSGTPFPFETV